MSKICDLIADSILDELYKQDPYSRVAIECLTTTGLVVVAGEVTTKGYVDVQKVVRNTLKDIGYTDPSYGIDCDDAGVLVSIHEQSPDIAMGVNEAENKEQGAGDQGLMFGFACRETEELMPLPIILAHKLTRRLAEVRKNDIIGYIGPDGKSQVSVEYEDDEPKRLEAVVISTQHKDNVDIEKLRADIMEYVIRPVCEQYVDENTKFHINPTGRFVIGGPEGDSGVTGRKIIVDTYGGMGRHGGGCFSGKDITKVDRSGAYVARYVAKNIVASGLADKCEVQISYAIGVAQPTSVLIDCFGTNKIPEERISELVKKHFDLRPRGIIEMLNLRRPIYKKTTNYGHFGKHDLPWEQIDKAEALKDDAGL